MTTEAFNPLTTTYARDVTATSQVINAAVTPPSGYANTMEQYMFTVIGSQPVFITSGPAGSTPVAVIPATGASGLGIPILPNSQTIMSFASGTVISCIAAAVGSTIYMTPGAGV
jgi:hypothetical protein